jgi:hypothetical protein
MEVLGGCDCFYSVYIGELPLKVNKKEDDHYDDDKGLFRISVSNPVQLRFRPHPFLAHLPHKIILLKTTSPVNF